MIYWFIYLAIVKELLFLQKINWSPWKQYLYLKQLSQTLKLALQIKVKNEKKKIFAKQESVLSNAEMLLIKRGELLDQFAKNNIISKDEKFFDEPKNIEKSSPEKSFFERTEVSKDKLNSIELKILRNKKLTTTIDKKQYTMSDINDLVN